jgi:hypothetical protein
LIAFPGVEVGRHQVLEREGVVAQDLGHGDALALVGHRLLAQVEVQDLQDLLGVNVANKVLMNPATSVSEMIGVVKTVSVTRLGEISPIGRLFK